MADKAYQISFDGEAAEADLYGAVQRLDVEESALTPGSFSIRLAIERDGSGQWAYTDDDRLSLFAAIEISVGFTSGQDSSAPGSAAGLEPVFEGYVTEVDLHLGTQPDDAYLDVRGTDVSVLLSLEEKAVAWPNMADSDIAQQIVAGYGFDVEATDTSPVHQENETLVLQRGSDAEFVRQLARRNGYLFTFNKQRGDDRSSCYFGPPRLDGAAQPDLAMLFGEQSNLASFDASENGLRPLAVSAQQLDPRSKEESDGSASDSDLAALGASGLRDLVSDRLGQLVQPLREQAGMLLLPQPTADASELKAVAQAVRDESEWLISATGEVNSDAYGFVLRPGRLVMVKGAGRQYSGRYFVTRVIHRIGGDGSYTQSFEARRNARDLEGTEEFGGAAASAIGLAAG